MKIFLVIIFTISGEPAVIEGFLPREHSSQAGCEAAALFALDHFAGNRAAYPELRVVDCVEADSMKEAIETFGVLPGELT
jgi:ribulose kinase